MTAARIAAPEPAAVSTAVISTVGTAFACERM